MAQTTVELGKIITDEQVIAAERLKPGDHVGFVEAGNAERVGKCENPIGIIDPFLTSPVKADQRCWLLLYQNSITTLRHHWTHPTFEAIVGTEQALGTNSRKWLTNFAAQELRMSYEDFIAHAKEFLRTGHSHCLTFDTPDAVYSERAEVWKHLENVLGIKHQDHGDTFFRCHADEEDAVNHLEDLHAGIETSRLRAEAIPEPVEQPLYRAGQALAAVG